MGSMNIGNGVTPRLFGDNNFDLIRIFAATQVLVLHAADRLEIEPMGFEGALAMFPGVPIFFVLSGFLVSASFDRSKTLVDYFRNRLLRIFPGLWVCLAVTLVALVALGINIWSPSIVPWLATQAVALIYTPDFLAGFGSGSYNGSLWTIPVELQFYAVLPIVFLLFRKHRLAASLGALALALLCAIALKTVLPHMGQASERGLEKLVRYSFAPHIYQFLLGVCMQIGGFWRSPYIRGKGILWLAAYIAFRLAAPQSAATNAVGTCLMGVAVIALAYTGPAISALKGRDISYGVYIYHGLVLNVMIELGLMGKPWQIAAALAASYAMGALSWVFVEKPALAHKAKATATATPESAAVTA